MRISETKKMMLGKSGESGCGVGDDSFLAGNNDSLQFSNVRSTEVTLTRQFNSSDLVIGQSTSFVIFTWNASTLRIYRTEMLSDYRKTPGEASGARPKAQKAANDLVWRVAA